MTQLLLQIDNLGSIKKNGLTKFWLKFGPIED